MPGTKCAVGSSESVSPVSYDLSRHLIEQRLFLQKKVAPFRSTVTEHSWRFLMKSAAQLKKNPNTILVIHGAPLNHPPFVSSKPKASVIYIGTEFWKKKIKKRFPKWHTTRQRIGIEQAIFLTGAWLSFGVTARTVPACALKAINKMNQQENEGDRSSSTNRHELLLT